MSSLPGHLRLGRLTHNERVRAREGGIRDSQEFIPAVAGQNVHLAPVLLSIASQHPWTCEPATAAPLLHPCTPKSRPRLVRGVKGPQLEVCAHPEVLSTCILPPRWANQT